MNLFWYELWRSYFYIQFQSLIYALNRKPKYPGADWGDRPNKKMNGLRWTEIQKRKLKYVNRKPKYVNRKPKYVNRKSKYVNRKLKYLNRKPKYLHRGRNIWRWNRNSFLNNQNSFLNNWNIFLNNRLIILVVVLIVINRLVARPARPASRTTWNLWLWCCFSVAGSYFFRGYFFFMYVYDSVFRYSSLYTVDILFSDNQGNHYSSIFDDYHYINLLKSYHKSVKMCCRFPLFIPPA
jgi:hypothetical protein